MPLHDWTCVEAGVFHHFHHSWIEEIQRALNKQALPPDYYALAEQHAGGLGPDVLTLQYRNGDTGEQPFAPPTSDNGGGVSLAPPPVHLVGETDLEYYRRKQNRVVIRHVTGDKVVAVVEVVSPGNKAGQHAVDSFVRKALELLDNDIHLMILDVHAPGKGDPKGIHEAIWGELTGESYSMPDAMARTFASYESDLAIRAYVEHGVVGQRIPDMPLFLQPRAHVMVPLEATYLSAFDAFPQRWRSAVE